jgi:hydroxylamine reductase
MEKMFCYQCEQAAKGEGCVKAGVCGKQPGVAALQDLLVRALVGLSRISIEKRKMGNPDRETGRFICDGLFSTLTNVNFDPERLAELIRQTAHVKQRLGSPESEFNFTGTTEELSSEGERFGINTYPAADGDILSLNHILLIGIKGVAAYANHAATLGQEDEEVYAFIEKGLAALDDEKKTMKEMIDMVLRCGEVNLKVMELLDRGNTGTYGHPVPTKVPLGAKRGKAVLVSGHDLKDLEELLIQTEGKDIQVYTHGEMLPCHAYPGLKKYPHFFGHYGTAWQNQAREFAAFPGAILMTTNCLQRPQDVYKDRVFTTGLVGWPGVCHVSRADFSAVIRKALELPGFTEDAPGGEVTTGFGHDAVFGVADRLIAAVKSGDIRHFFLVAGCDGAKPGRNYYTEFVENVPRDCVVLTLACGKFRFFDKQLGDIGGIPRLLDIGQCNDAYSAIQIAVALSKAFDVGVNELPLSLILSWYEQKAVAILLTLLALGIKNIRLGPSLPAFVTPNIMEFLVKTFDIKPITTAEADLKAILG